MQVVRTPVDLPEATFWKLAAIAETHDMKVPEFLLELAVTASRIKNPMESDPVVRRWREGFTDKQIAAEFGMTNLAVAAKRQSYNLPANRRAA